MNDRNSRGRARRWDGMDDAVLPSVKTAAAYRAAARHSRRVRILRIALPVTAIVCIAVFSWFTFLSTPSSVDVQISGAGIKDGKLVMTNPKLSGFTGKHKNMPYSMTAARALQDIGKTNIFNLEDIHATLPLSPKQTVALDAGSGVFDNTKQKLELGSGITLKTSDGAVATFRSAEIDIPSGKMKTDEPVTIDNGKSTLNADSMTVSREEGLIVFDRQVSLVLQPAALHNSTPASTGN